MKTKLKAMFATAALSSAGLCFTVSHALAAVPQIASNHLVIVNKYTSIDGAELSSTLYATEKFAQIFDKPLVKIPLNTNFQAKVSYPAKKSELFELTTVLNDKLQKLIANFTHKSPSYSINEDGEMTLKKDQHKKCNMKQG